MVDSITILGGRGRDGSEEPVRVINFKMGDIASIVGPTGSGKTTLINDIELFADANTPSQRRILINGNPPSPEFRDNPAFNPIALITQHTTFLSDLPVGEFLTIHTKIRSERARNTDYFLQKTLSFANQLTGEPIMVHSKMTELSGGQTRALLIADATIICETPIILLDEVENAGIHRNKAIELLREYKKIFIFVTHDPRIALLSDYRIVVKEGAISKVLFTDEYEHKFAQKVSKLDDILSELRNRIRVGERITNDCLAGIL
ncbi:MAG: ATP-binding cassette domain-containing protein [Oligoflexia bacterium]|nr:ATP-binding cassette domain-containing protein [Oligoflexia bacterium]